MSRMSTIDRAVSRYHSEAATATERAEATVRNVQTRRDELIDAAHKMIAAAEAEAEGVTASAENIALRAVEAATKRLDQALSESAGAPANASIKDNGALMELHLGSQVVGTAGPASGSWLVTVGGQTACLGSWVSARQLLWQKAREQADRTILLGARA